MNADAKIAAEEVVALAAIATGDLLAQGEARTLPNPRRIIATLVFYGGLSLVASTGEGPARFAAASGFVAMLATLVIGPGGKAITSLLKSVTAFAGTPEGNQPAVMPPGVFGPTGPGNPNPSLQGGKA